MTDVDGNFDARLITHTTNDFRFKINDLVINQGSEFIVAIAGEMMRMPGLPADPQAKRIDIIDGEIEGLS